MSLAREVTYLRTLGLGDVDLSRAAGSADQARGWPPSDPAESGWTGWRGSASWWPSPSAWST